MANGRARLEAFAVGVPAPGADLATFITEPMYDGWLPARVAGEQIVVSRGAHMAIIGDPTESPPVTHM